ncbi:hypothetical protein [Streptomyces sp. NPDC059063]|uniref:hypothetical protein n=1 Tax=unclassified Streptomyces TaxID=2593676 RepID=UPI003690893D
MARVGTDGTAGTAVTGHRQWIEGATIHGPVVQAHEIHSVQMHHARPLYGVEAFPLTRPPIPESWVRAQPARLLDARHGLVGFTGRRTELARLTEWRDRPDRVTALLVHGPGGQGKSRMAARFAQLSHEAGWDVLQARHASDALPSSPRPIGGSASGRAGVLMVVDYAERWPTADLIELLVDAARQGGRVRVLLVARPRGTWWQYLVHRLGGFDIPLDDLPLPGLADDAEVSPQRLFRTARDCFAQALGVADVEGIDHPEGLGTDPEYRQVLAVHMAALAAVDARRRNLAVPGGAAEVSAYLLARERAHWESLHGNHRVRITAHAFGQVVYTAALTNALSYREALQVLARIGVGSAEHADQILKDHALSYPGPEGATVLEPLYPDRLAEDFLALSVPGHGITGFEPDPWAVDAPRRLLEGQALSCRRRALATLVATAARWPHVRADQLEPLLRAEPRLGVAAGGATLAALSEIEGMDLSVLEGVEAHLPEGAHTDLNSGAAALSQRLAEYRLSRLHDPEEQARILNELAQRQSHAGLHDQALKSGQRAMAIRRSMTDPHAVAREPSFAEVLCDVGVYLAKRGDTADALAATEQAVRVLRGLADEEPGRHDDALAVALSNCAADLATEGHWATALATAQEAVDIRRRQAAAAAGGPGPTAHSAALAAALANLAICLAYADRRHDAVAAAQEAVGIQRALARSHPHTHEPTLASALVNLSRRLSDVSRPRQACDAATEAVQVLRRLVDVSPAAYEEVLAIGLLNLGSRLASLSHHEEACRVLDESAGIRRGLAAARPGRHETALAASLETLAVQLYRTRHHGRALLAWKEAMDLRRALAGAGGQAERRHLADMLCTIAWMHVIDRRELPTALAAAEEATRLLWPLGRQGGTLGQKLAHAVDIHARALVALGRDEEARVLLRRFARSRDEGEGVGEGEEAVVTAFRPPLPPGTAPGGS